jgi:hypothetical protein
VILKKLEKFSKADSIGKGGSPGNFGIFILNVNKKQVGYTACGITFRR